MSINKLNIMYNIKDPKIKNYEVLNDGKVETVARMATGLVGTFAIQEFTKNVYVINDIEQEKITHPLCEHVFTIDTKQVRSADESFTCIYTCQKCGFCYSAN